MEAGEEEEEKPERPPAPIKPRRSPTLRCRRSRSPQKEEPLPAPRKASDRVPDAMAAGPAPGLGPSPPSQTQGPRSLLTDLRKALRRAGEGPSNDLSSSSVHTVSFAQKGCLHGESKIYSPGSYEGIVGLFDLKVSPLFFFFNERVAAFCIFLNPNPHVRAHAPQGLPLTPLYNQP